MDEDTKALLRAVMQKQRVTIEPVTTPAYYHETETTSWYVMFPGMTTNLEYVQRRSRPFKTFREAAEFAVSVVELPDKPAE